RPVAALAGAAGLEIGPGGGILVDERGCTSDPSICAAGDCAEFSCERRRVLPLGSIANRTGRLVANTIAGVEDTMPCLLGSEVIKVFDLHVGCCGETASRLRAEEVGVEEVWGAFTDRAPFYPEAATVRLKVIRETEGPLRGLQVVSGGAVVRWVNTFAQILDLAGGEAGALGRLEHAYAPTCATALDPLHTMASILESGPEMQLPPDAFLDGGEKGWTVVNMLTEAERNRVGLPALVGRVVEMDLAALRTDWRDLPERGVVTVCAKGGRSYEAARFLRDKGIEARYLAGGIGFYNV
ncbi:MAG TPA: hypothetical protein ENI92_04065, partial [Bacteroidetes bacterium]|nr:hypothetical protein [Bacteroidota bacterium]